MNTTCPEYNENGVQYLEWVSSYLGECAYSRMQIASVFIGISSIVFWIFAQVPQLIVNYQLQSADGLSPFFLGDSLNLAGCILTNQNAAQLYTAIYFCSMDLILISQFIYYHNKSRLVANRMQQVEQPFLQSPNKTLFCMISIFIFASTCLPSFQSTKINNSSHFGNRKLLTSIVNTPKPAYYIGMAIGWISAASYLGSRFPQLIQNFKRKSTQGLSPLMFFMAIMGNFSYSLSIFLYAQDWPDLWFHFPWIVGSAGTLVLDFIALQQFLRYKVDIKVVEVSYHIESQEYLPIGAKTGDEQRRAYYGRIGISS